MNLVPSLRHLVGAAALAIGITVADAAEVSDSAAFPAAKERLEQAVRTGRAAGVRSDWCAALPAGSYWV